MKKPYLKEFDRFLYQHNTLSGDLSMLDFLFKVMIRDVLKSFSK